MSKNPDPAIQVLLEKIRKSENHYSSLRSARQTLNGQLNETEVVQAEINLLDDGDDIYKLIGTVLVKQDIVEAKNNMATRISYIQSEVQRLNTAIMAVEAELNQYRGELAKFQTILKENARTEQQEKGALPNFLN